ncbi:MAG: methionyl-tRNA formyltransferase [Synergistetes bacterium]|nr:methionyl-tRNA formyltransferase [Synergistota bacterium]
MAKVKIVLAGSGPFGIPSFDRICSHFDVIGVITHVDRPKGRGYKLSPTPVALWAKERELRVWKLSSIKEFTPVGDILVVIDCGFIIPRSVIDSYPLGVIALHPSLLPRYRGAAPIRRVIMAGERKTGVTTFFVNERVDAGDIILQEETYIGEKETYGELVERLSRIGAELVERTLVLISEGRAPRIPQDENLATYAPKIKKEERVIDWNAPAESIERLVRALCPYPGALTRFRGRILKVLEVEAIDKNTVFGEPGSVLEVFKEGVKVAAGKGIVLVRKVQPEGKRCMNVREFCCGYKPARGEILGK